MHIYRTFSLSVTLRVYPLRLHTSMRHRLRRCRSRGRGRARRLRPD